MLLHIKLKSFENINKIKKNVFEYKLELMYFFPKVQTF